MNSTMKQIAVVALATIASAGALRAQAIDARWQAWAGCWAPVSDDAGSPRELGGSARLCVVPAQGTAAVEVLTVANGKIVDRTRIEVDGTQHQVSRDGCNGTETASWSAVGTRVFITSNLTCTGGVMRRTRSVMSFTQRYEWLDVRGMASANGSGVAVARYVASDDTTGLPAELKTVASVRSQAANTALLAAASPLTLADIADVAMMSDSGVASTWLMMRTQGVKLSVDGQQLVALADQGVPSSVIDVVVALAHPGVFALNPNSREAEFKPGQVTSAARSAYDVRGAGGYGYVGAYAGYPMFGFGWSPYSSYGYGYGYSPYSYYGYGSGYGYGYGYGGGYAPYYGYYPGYQPIIVVTRGSDGGSASAPHGRMVKGQGYQGPSSSGSSSGGSTSSSSGGSSSGSSGSTGSAPSTSGSAPASTPASSGGDRTAVRKPPM